MKAGVTPPPLTPSLAPMRLLTKLSDPVDLQILCDALDQRHIRFTAEHAGMHALMPLPGIMDVQVMVDDGDLAAARRILRDMDLGA